MSRSTIADQEADEMRFSNVPVFAASLIVVGVAVYAQAPQPAAKPAAVEEWEKKNSGKKKIVVRDGRTGG